MADFGAPSFSLGFDFDFSDPQVTNASENNKDLSASNRFPAAPTGLKDDDDEDFATLTVVDSDTDSQSSPPKLKRLRRGCTVENTVSSASVKSKADLLSSVLFDDDDIEDFSSPEDNHTDEHRSTQHPSVCTSSKFALNRLVALTKQSGKRKQTTSDGPESTITTCNNPPKLSRSPLRKFQLIDSDSDSDFDNPKNTFNQSKSNSNLGQPKKSNESNRKDLWEDFRPETSFHIPTPALDEVCDEYFRSIKDQKPPQSNNRKKNHVANTIIDLSDPLSPIPPAHGYFFHNDLRIQDLVRSRLPNFFPLIATNRDCEQPGTSNIDYMGQFSHGESSKQGGRTNKGETSSRRNSRKSKSQEMLSSQGTMNPNVRVPKVAGKRRVQADGNKAAGHWFTNQDGKRVYVRKDGQEMTGRAAYMNYKKESGGGYKRNAKAKKKSVTKKK